MGFTGGIRRALARQGMAVLTVVADFSSVPRALPQKIAGRPAKAVPGTGVALTPAQPSVRDSAQSAWRVLPRRLFFEPAD
jgi:hypothetical protein